MIELNKKTQQELEKGFVQGIIDGYEAYRVDTKGTIKLISLEDFEKALEEVSKKTGFREIKTLDNGLYKVAECIICGEKFLQEVDAAIKDEVSCIKIDRENLDKFKKK